MCHLYIFEYARAALVGIATMEPRWVAVGPGRASAPRWTRRGIAVLHGRNVTVPLLFETSETTLQ